MSTLMLLMTVSSLIGKAAPLCAPKAASHHPRASGKLVVCKTPDSKRTNETATIGFGTGCYCCNCSSLCELCGCYFCKKCRCRHIPLEWEHFEMRWTTMVHQLIQHKLISIKIRMRASSPASSAHPPKTNWTEIFVSVLFPTDFSKR